jgi:hypothetical protein
MNQPPLDNNTQHTHENINHHHHGPPKPSASRGSNFTGECNRRASSDRSLSSQHVEALYIDKSNFSFINLTAILCELASMRSLTKGEFLKEYLVMFLCRCIETTRTNPSYLAIPYLTMSPENVKRGQTDQY